MVVGKSDTKVLAQKHVTTAARTDPDMKRLSEFAIESQTVTRVHHAAQGNAGPFYQPTLAESLLGADRDPADYRSHNPGILVWQRAPA